MNKPKQTASFSSLKTFSSAAVQALQDNPVMVMAGAGFLMVALFFKGVVEPANVYLWAKRPLLDLSTILHNSALEGMKLFAVFSAIFALYLLALWAARRAKGWDAWLVVIVSGVAMGAVLLYMFPYGAADLFDYIMHARMISVYHVNPFVDLMTPFARDPFYNYAYWHSVPTAYGPLFEWINSLVPPLVGWSFVPNVVAFKLVSGVFYLGSIAMIALTLRHADPKRALAGALFFAWNPVVLYETFGNGHNDMVMVFFMLLAVWAMQRKYYEVTVLALVAGALVKYMPILLLPAAGLIALRELSNWKKRTRFILISILGSLAMGVACFAPFWNGPDTLSIARRATLLTSSLPSVIYFSIYSFTKGLTGTLVSGTFAALTVAFALYQGYRAYKDPRWTSFAEASTNVMLFYLLVCCLWFQVWYAIWPIALAAFLPGGFTWTLALILSGSVLIKPFIIRPVFLWHMPDIQRLPREAYLWVGMQALPWLYALLHFLWPKKKAAAPEPTLKTT